MKAVTEARPDIARIDLDLPGFDDLYVKPLDLERLSSLLGESAGEG